MIIWLGVKSVLRKYVGIVLSLLFVAPALIGTGALELEPGLETEVSSALEQQVLESGLVCLADFVPDLVIELRYAGDDNLLGVPVYFGNYAFLRSQTADKLARANERFMQDGYRLKIWDAYRPRSIHSYLWAEAGEHQHFFAEPRFGSLHSRGCAVDVTLVDGLGRELAMPSDFDDFSGAGARYSQMSPEARENMHYLTEIMEENGFVGIDKEWWHFADSEWWRFPLLDISLEQAVQILCTE
ncbi:MAG: peptidase M15 [Firmicutes bacterium]|nr:peptidase M15 [Bacillota bacterium]